VSIFTSAEAVKTKRTEWISTLKVGDEVAISSRYHLQVCKVSKITPSGRLNLDNNAVVNSDGSIRGDSYNHIEQVTDEIRIKIWRGRAMNKIRLKMKLEKLTNKNLKIILDIVNDSLE